MVTTNLNLSMNNPEVVQIHAKQGDSGRLYKINLKDATEENGTLRILRPDGVEVTADAIKSAGGDAYKGDLVTFDALEEVPLTKCEVTLESSQDLHGYDNPWPSGGGKNLFDKTNSVIDGFVGSTGTYAQPTSGEKSAISGYLPSGTYTISKISSSRFRVGLFQSVPSSYGTASEALWTANPQTATSLTITTSVDGYLIIFMYNGSSETHTAQEIADTIQIEVGNQATEWSPYSNICPIVASNDNEDQAIYVEQRGKNLLPNLKAQINGNTVSIGQQVGGDTTTVFLPQGTFTLYVPYPSAVSVYHRFNGTSARLGDTNTAINLTFEEDGMHSFWLYKSGGVSVDDVGDFQLELGNQATAYEPYQGSTHSISLGRKVYGGKVDLVSGKLTVTHASVDMGDLSWTRYSNGDFFYSFITDIVPGTTDAICTMFKNSGNGIRFYITNNSKQVRVYCKALNIADGTAFQTFVDGQLIVYRLETPIEIQL